MEQSAVIGLVKLTNDPSYWILWMEDQAKKQTAWQHKTRTWNNNVQGAFDTTIPASQWEQKKQP